MRITRVLAVAALTLLLAGCEPTLSVQPLYRDENDTVAEPAFIGSWGGGNGEELEGVFWMQADGEKEYTLTWAEEGKVMELRVRLVPIGDLLFMDAYPDDLTDKDLHQPYPHLIGLHAFYRIQLENEQFRIAFLDDDWLKRKLDDGAIQIAHAPTKRGLVLTASPDELRNLLAAYGSDAEAFADLEPLPRIPEADALVFLGKTYRDLDRLTEAVDCFEQALEFDPEHKAARAELEATEALLEEQKAREAERLQALAAPNPE